MTIPYTRDTWVDDTTSVSAARMNNLEDGVAVAQRQPAVRAYHNANQSITNATDTALALNSERFDTAGGSADTQHDVTTNNSRLTCRYAGKYLITGCAQFAGNATGDRYLWVKLNAATKLVQSHATADATENTLVVTTLYDLAVNDYVELFVHQSSGGALNVSAAGNMSPEFSMVRVA